MYMSARLPAALALLVFLVTGLHVSGTAAARFETQSGCGKTASSRMKKVPLASMTIKTPIHVMHESGKFYRVDLHNHVRTLISDHGFAHAAQLVPSANGKWISYSASRTRGASTQYWVYNRDTSTDRLVLEHPVSGGGIPEFSPDSKFLAIAANYDSRWGGDAGAGIFLFDTKTWRPVSVKLPTAIATKDAWASPQWSRDGEELLIMVRSVGVTGAFEYYSYRPSTRAIEKISGRYDSSIYDHIFMRRGRDIPQFAKVSPRSILGLKSESSPDGKSRAFLGSESPGKPYPLKVVDRNGVTKEIAYGHYDNCEGNTLFITGWLDEQHLVYRDRSLNYRVFETSTGTTADLFSEKEDVRVFTW